MESRLACQEPLQAPDSLLLWCCLLFAPYPHARPLSELDEPEDGQGGSPTLQEPEVLRALQHPLLPTFHLPQLQAGDRGPQVQHLQERLLLPEEGGGLDLLCLPEDPVSAWPGLALGSREGAGPGPCLQPVASFGPPRPSRRRAPSPPRPKVQPVVSPSVARAPAKPRSPRPEVRSPPPKAQPRPPPKRKQQPKSSPQRGGPSRGGSPSRAPRFW